ncbi:alanine racemase [Jongsikchunia kroppenstedtii]|uniref:alanine racemase n=1 Tax=Jongsikchunia kroppenstedtii TaxID=1121721 RepID=UPI000364E457|nr:alanine racemase [Jongsikchunia kroppenstedtii]
MAAMTVTSDSASPRTPSDAGLVATVDLAAVRHNVGVLRGFAGRASVMAVVKADGYGHGATQVARAAVAAGAAELGVATIAEGLALRADGITAAITSWLHAPGADFAAAIAADVGVSASSVRQLHEIVAAARSLGRTATLNLKVDTGLARNGVAPDEWADIRDALAKAVAEEAVALRTVFCHLALADQPDNPHNDLQAARLDEACADLDRVGVAVPARHISNSAATVTRPDLARDLVRPGIAVYGLSPIPERGDFGLTQVMTLSARIALLKNVKAGQGVSYGHTWTAAQDGTLALLPIGYADGLPRLLSGRFDVAIDGRRYPGVGRICMDQCLVDLGTDRGTIAEGDRAVIFGRPDRGEPTATEIADAIGTIDYEIVSGVRGRVVREYTDLNLRGGEQT